MTTAARDIAGLFPQPRQGVAARFAHRLGGALRTIVAGSVTLAGSLRRRAVRKSTSAPRVAGDRNATRANGCAEPSHDDNAIPPVAPHVPCRPHAAATFASRPARASLIPRLLGGIRPRDDQEHDARLVSAPLAGGLAGPVRDRVAQHAAHIAAIRSTCGNHGGHPLSLPQRKPRRTQLSHGSPTCATADHSFAIEFFFAAVAEGFATAVASSAAAGIVPSKNHAGKVQFCLLWSSLLC